MGTYYIPRNYKGETRILYIFTVKSLVTMKFVGLIMMALFAFIGWAIGALKIPTIVAIPITKKIGGEPLSEIIIRYIKFKKNKKIYMYYTKEEK